MKLVKCESENIPRWIFPEVAKEYPGPGTSVDIFDFRESDFEALSKTLKLDDTTLTWEDSGCEIGFSHDAPDSVRRLRTELVGSLASIPIHERWKCAEEWADLALERRPNNQDRTHFKAQLNIICDQAIRAHSSSHVLILVEPYE